MKAIVYNIFGLGHINPTLPLIKNLVEVGVEVIYHSSPERRALIESTGALFRNYGRDDYKAADYNPGKNFVLQTIPATLGLLPVLLEEIERERPDFLIYDSMAPWGKALTQITGLPSYCTVTTFALSRE
jgi:UDP:flavonoid glycosyltransferase YjiC (YdhE family)